MPVQLISFKGQIKDCAAQLEWSTAVETNFSHFTIERSDGSSNFINIGNLSSKGSHSNYQFTDKNPESGANLYRLKMVDNDGSFSLSENVRINFNCQQQVIAVRPNPVSDFCMLKGLATGDKYSIYNSKGQVVWNGKATGPEQVIDASTWPTGVYILSILRPNNSVKINLKLVKQ